MDFRSYLFETDFNMKYINNKLDIINYTKIDTVMNNKVVIKYSEGILDISGDDLKIIKLTQDELLISGVFKNIEFRWLYVFKSNWYKS